MLCGVCVCACVRVSSCVCGVHFEYAAWFLRVVRIIFVQESWF